MDVKGQLQTVELTHWMTQLTDQQAKRLEDFKRQQAESLLQSGQIIQNIDEAAAYVGVDVETIRARVRCSQCKRRTCDIRIVYSGPCGHARGFHYRD